MPITITGILATDETPARSISSSFTIEPIDYADTTQPIGTTYESLTFASDSPTGTFWTILENTGDAEAVYRIFTDGTNYVFFPLPVGSVVIVPSSLVNAGSSAAHAVGEIQARSLTGSTTVRVITFYVL